MRIWEDGESWIEEIYIFTMHTPIGTKYSIGMLRKFIQTVSSKTEAMVVIPRDDIYQLFSRHYNLVFVSDTENGKLYLAKHKE